MNELINHKKYMDILHFRSNFSDCFSEGDIIVIQEKIDGANFSFQYDINSNSIKSYSRRQVLDTENNLQGGYEWSQELNVDQFSGYPTFRVFGEWLCKHKVKYPQDKYNEVYVYDIYDMAEGKYYNQHLVEGFCEKNNLKYVPVFYAGVFKSWEHCLSFVGKTKMGGEYGEGIVIKNMTRLNDPSNRRPFYTKIVSEDFQEIMKTKIKIIDPEKLKQKEIQRELAESIVTYNRVEKILFKLIEDSIIPYDWSELDLGIIARNLPTRMYYDCLKEEKETVDLIGQDFGKLCGNISMQHTRDILKKK